MHVDVVRWFINEGAERRHSAKSTSFQYQPKIRRRSCRTSSSANGIEKALRRELRRDARRPPEIPEHGDQGCSLINHRYNSLRITCAVLERVDNGLLHFDLSTPIRPNSSRIWNRDVAVHVHSLIGNGNEISGSDTAFGRYK